jgi:hypothetical protein
MIMRKRSPDGRTQRPIRKRAPRPRLAAAAQLGAAAALLVSCGSSGKGLIPIGKAGPLQSDFEEVAQAAQNAGGSCTATEAAILKTERDYGTLPATVDLALRKRLHEGIQNLAERARQVCSRPLPQATATGTSPKTTTSTIRTTSTATTPTPTTTTTQASTTPTTTPTTASPGGSSPGPGAGGVEASPGAGNGQGGGAGAGVGAGSGSGSGGAGAGSGGQEGGK